MRKIVFIFILFIITLLLTSCKSIISVQSLSDSIKYIEYLRLRGQTNEFFIEIVIGRSNLEDFVKIIALPKKINSPEKITYVYGEYRGEIIKNNGKLTAEIRADAVEDFIVITACGDREIVELQPLTPEIDAEKVMEKAIYHIENISENKDEKYKEEIKIKILADMHANAYVFVTFEGGGQFYSLLFDSETYDIVAEYNL